MRPANDDRRADDLLVSFAAAAVQASGLALHQHFNRNDLYHVIQIAGLYLLYRGARLVKDPAASTGPAESLPPGSA